jgi:hypothetical protein
MVEFTKPDVIIDTLKNDDEVSDTTHDLSKEIVEFFEERDIPPRTGAFICALAMSSIEIASIAGAKLFKQKYPNADAGKQNFVFSECYKIVTTAANGISSQFPKDRESDHR